MDDSFLFFLIAVHWFTWNKIVLLKKVYFGRKIESKKMPPKKPIKYNKSAGLGFLNAGFCQPRVA